MKTRTLIVMMVAAVLAIAAAAWVSSSRNVNTAAPQLDVLAPGLSDALGEVNQVRIVAAGNAVLATMQRGEDGAWTLQEKNGYPVDLEPLRELLANIAAARQMEAKTALPDRHAQLGVEDVSAEDARGVQVDIQAPNQTWSFVFGDNPVRGTGTYVRETGKPQSWLVDKAIAVERKPANWLAKRIIDVGANRVQAVSIEPVEGPAFGIHRQEGDTTSDFALDALPRGREAGEGYQREALAGVLSGLNFEDVFTLTDKPVPEKTRISQFELEDGRQLRIASWQDEGRTLVHLSMSLDAERAQAWQARPLAQAETDADADATTAAKTTIDPAAQVAEFEREHAVWVYVLPAFKATNLGKSLEDYLKPKP